MIEVLERLAAAHIQLLPTAEINTHFVFERGGYIALVERRDNDFGSVGAGGLLTPSGFAALLWRQEHPWFVAKGFQREASAEEVSALRDFQRDLEAALKRDKP